MRALVLGLFVVAVSCVTERGAVQAGDRGGSDVRSPAVAGRFYPGNGDVLARAVDAMLAAARPAGGERPIALVAPHAGYIYSGQIAADAFAQAKGETYDTVVILGTNHTRAPFDGVAVYPGAGFRTPLGTVQVDREVAAALVASGRVARWDAGPHEAEHSVEVQVPFVQRLWPAARIVPLVVGTDDPAVCARAGQALAGVLSGRRALIVASSDLSHYPPAASARDADRRTLEAMATLDPGTFDASTRQVEGRGVPGLSTAACGRAPVLVALNAARALGATFGRVVSYANSADVAVGDPARVVGYGAVAFSAGRAGTDVSALRPRGGSGTPATAALSLDDKRALVRLAHDTIVRYLETETLPLARDVPASLFDRRQGAFVTLRARGQLRGCIGRIVHDGPVPPLVSRVALEAAVNDSRFPPLRAKELTGVEVEVSLLTEPRDIASAAQVQPGRDGVVLRKDGHSAVFLPQVATEQGWGRDELLDQLCQKAGLPTGCWARGARLSTFQAEVFSERDVR